MCSIFCFLFKVYLHAFNAPTKSVCLCKNLSIYKQVCPYYKNLSITSVCLMSDIVQCTDSSYC